MPIRLYLQVIGQTSIIDGLDEYKDTDVLFEELPTAIKDALLYRRLFMRHIYGIFAVLEELQLLHYLGEDKSLERLFLSKEACMRSSLLLLL